MKKYITETYFRDNYLFSAIDEQQRTKEQIEYAIGVASSRVNSITGGAITKGIREGYYTYSDLTGIVLDESKISDPIVLAEAKDATDAIKEQVAAMAKFAIDTNWDFISGSFSSSLGAQSDSETIDFESSLALIEKTVKEALAIYEFQTLLFTDEIDIAASDSVTINISNGYNPNGDKRYLTEQGLVDRLTDQLWFTGKDGITVVEKVPGSPSQGIFISGGSGAVIPVGTFTLNSDLLVANDTTSTLIAKIGDGFKGSQQYGNSAVGTQQYGANAVGTQYYGAGATGDQYYGSASIGDQFYGLNATGDQNYGKTATGNQYYGKAAKGKIEIGSDASGTQLYGSGAIGSQFYGLDAKGKQYYGSNANAEQNYGRGGIGYQYYGAKAIGNQYYGDGAIGNIIIGTTEPTSDPNNNILISGQKQATFDSIIDAANGIANKQDDVKLSLTANGDVFLTNGGKFKGIDSSGNIIPIGDDGDLTNKKYVDDKNTLQDQTIQQVQDAIAVSLTPLFNSDYANGLPYTRVDKENAFIEIPMATLSSQPKAGDFLEIFTADSDAMKYTMVLAPLADSEANAIAVPTAAHEKGVVDLKMFIEGTNIKITLVTEGGKGYPDFPDPFPLKLTELAFYKKPAATISLADYYTKTETSTNFLSKSELTKNSINIITNNTVSGAKSFLSYKTYADVTIGEEAVGRLDFGRKATFITEVGRESSGVLRFGSDAIGKIEIGSTLNDAVKAQNVLIQGSKSATFEDIIDSTTTTKYAKDQLVFFDKVQTGTIFEDTTLFTKVSIGIFTTAGIVVYKAIKNITKAGTNGQHP